MFYFKHTTAFEQVKYQFEITIIYVSDHPQKWLPCYRLQQLLFEHFAPTSFARNQLLYSP